MRARVYSAMIDARGQARMVAIDAKLNRGLSGLRVRGVRGGDELLEQCIRAALGRCGYALHTCERVVDLPYLETAPHGLALASVVALLGAQGLVSRDRLHGVLVWGDLAADGSIVSTLEVDRVVALALAEGMREVVVPAASLPSCSPSTLRVLASSDVAELVALLRGELPFRGWLGPISRAGRGLTRVRGLLEVMLAGWHHALAVVGWSEARALVRRLAAMLPEPDETLAAERRALGSIGADPSERVLVLQPDTSEHGLLGRHPARPGIACLAHGGVLVLDDLRRYSRQLLAGVRATVWREVNPPRPAEFVLLATTRPRKREPAPLDAPPELPFVTVAAARESEQGSQAIDSLEGSRSRITLARARQLRRFGAISPTPPWIYNARIPATPICLDRFCATSHSGRRLLDTLTRAHGWSQYQRANVLRVARTIADLDPDRDPRAPLDHDCLATAAMFMPRTP